MRAKALTDAKRQGLDAQKLAGHASAAMTEHYIKAREIDVVSTLDTNNIRQVAKILDKSRKQKT